jgi:hypothetical protein
MDQLVLIEPLVKAYDGTAATGLVVVLWGFF